MQRIGVRELNQRTSQVIERVKRGQVVEVTDRGKLVARLVPVEAGRTLLDRLVAEGQAVAPTATGPIPMPVVVGDPTLDVAAELAAARDEERW